MTKTIFLLNIDDFEPEITRITYPFIRLYADRIGAEIFIISERKFPDWPVTYEKLQIHELGKKIGSDWNLYIDSDTLIHPECPDFTLYLPMGTVSFHAPDESTVRFKTNDYFLRDGRYLAPGNWFTIASRLCLDLWRPLEVEPDQAIGQIFPSVNEKAHGIKAEHLIDDYALACNISRFGLRYKSFVQIYKDHGFPKDVKGNQFEFLAHQYTMTPVEKIEHLKKAIEMWEVGNGVLHTS